MLWNSFVKANNLGPRQDCTTLLGPASEARTVTLKQEVGPKRWGKALRTHLDKVDRRYGGGGESPPLLASSSPASCLIPSKLP